MALLYQDGESTQALEKEIRELRAVIYGNLAACHLKEEDYEKVVEACNEAIMDDPRYFKVINRRAIANEKIGTWSSLMTSLEDYKMLSDSNRLPSSHKAVDQALVRLPKRIEEASQREKDEMLQKLKGVGDSVLGWFGLSTDNFQVKKGEGGGYNLNFNR